MGRIIKSNTGKTVRTGPSNRKALPARIRKPKQFKQKSFEDLANLLRQSLEGKQ